MGAVVPIEDVAIFVDSRFSMDWPDDGHDPPQTPPGRDLAEWLLSELRCRPDIEAQGPYESDGAWYINLRRRGRRYWLVAQWMNVGEAGHRRDVWTIQAVLVRTLLQWLFNSGHDPEGVREVVAVVDQILRPVPSVVDLQWVDVEAFTKL